MAVLGDMVAIVAAFSLGATIMYANPVDIQARDTIAAILPVYLLMGIT